MTVEECYMALGGNYQDALGRLMNETLVKRFVFKFPDDKSYELLCTSCHDGNGEEAFRAGHTLKGVCQNLGFDRLYESSNKITEMLRSREISAEAIEQLQQVEKDYEQTVSAIRRLQEEG